jgi:hypothetical protein
MAALGLGLVAMALGVGCATAAGGEGALPPQPKNLKAADYYPLTPGWRWAYDLEKDGQKILAMYAVLERTIDTAIVQAGDERLIYAIGPDGVAQREGTMLGDFVIKDPVAVGTEWPVAGGRARIVSVTEQVTTLAGKFPWCVVVEVSRTSPTRVVRTTFAPEVGPVQIEVLVQSGGSMVPVTRASLRAVTRPGEDPLAAH